MNNTLVRIKAFVLKNKLEVLVLVSILLLAAFLRLYKISEYMTFLGDEGRDALVVKRILVEHRLTLLGPPTSVGNMYLGPLYYYMMSASMAVSWMNPVAAAVMVALIGVLTVALVYYLAREWFGVLAAILSSSLYAFSFVNISLSHSSWNPNPTPFFALGVILGFYLSQKFKNYLFLIMSGISLAFAVQMHYLALILIPVAIIFWIKELHTKGKVNFKLGSIGVLLAFLLLMSPLAIFDLRYNFMNFRAFRDFFFSKDSAVGFNLGGFIGGVANIFTNNLIGRYIAGGNFFIALFLSLVIIGVLTYVVFNTVKGKVLNFGFFAITTWLLVGLVGLSLYHQSIYDHYLGFLNPAPFLFLGASVKLGLSSNFFNKYFKYLFVFIIFGILVLINLDKSPFKTMPNNQLKRTQEIAKFVILESRGRPYNFALISANNYDAAYQFYLDQYGDPPQEIQAVVTDQLFVVCEDQVCKPVGHPKYEIAGFGWTKIESEVNFDDVKVYKLIHNPAQLKNNKNV